MTKLSFTKITLCLGNPFLPFHSIPIFHFFQLMKSFKLFHSIPFFSTIFFNFPNSYTISLNLNHSYYLKISKVKPFLHHFSKLFSNHSNYFLNHFLNYFSNHPKWSKMSKMTHPNTWLEVPLLASTYSFGTFRKVE